MNNTIIQYTEEQVKQMTNQELVEHLQGKRKDWIKKNQSIMYIEVLNRTNFLDEYVKKYEHFEFQIRLYVLKNNYTYIPTCELDGCHNSVSWNHTLHIFGKFCCREHNNIDPNFKSRVEKGSLEKLGVKCSFELESVKIKTKNTLLKKFGVDNPQKSNEIKLKTKNTNNFKYGGNSPYSSKCV